MVTEAKPGALRKVANGFYTSTIEGITINVERDEASRPALSRVKGQRHWWTWSTGGTGFTDGKAYTGKQSAFLAALFWTGLDAEIGGKDEAKADGVQLDRGAGGDGADDVAVAARHRGDSVVVAQSEFVGRRG